MPTLKVKPAGQPVPRADKRAAESIVYTLDCSELLDTNEIATSVEAVTSAEGLTLSGLRTRRGVAIEVKVDNTPLDTASHIDYTIELKFTTIFGSTKLAVFQVRVHR